MKKIIVSIFVSAVFLVNLCISVNALSISSASNENNVAAVGQIYMINSNVYRVTSDKKINVFYERSLVDFDVQPIIIEDRTMVPVRKIANLIGVKDSNIKYDEKSETIELKYNNKLITMLIGDKTAYIDRDAVELDVPALEIDGRTLVPLRFVSEVFGCKVDYGEGDSAINIYLKKSNAATKN